MRHCIACVEKHQQPHRVSTLDKKDSKKRGVICVTSLFIYICSCYLDYSQDAVDEGGDV